MSAVRDDFWQQTQYESVRVGFGRGLVAAGQQDKRVVALSADLTESVQMQAFGQAYPERLVQVGVAEQNLVTVAAGLARAGYVPFAASYAAFSPGRNWEQIRTTICLNDLPVKLVGSHAGVSVGPDGATHQMLEDIALMRVLPNMVVIAPGDSAEAERATRTIALDTRPAYMRLCRDKTAQFLAGDEPFVVGRARTLRRGDDITLLGTGTMTAGLLRVAAMLAARDGVAATVVHVPTIKPLDSSTILTQARRTGRVVTAEEAQAAAGFGGAVAELLIEYAPMPLLRIGVADRFGQSGPADQLMAAYGLDHDSMYGRIRRFMHQTNQRL